MFKTNQTFIALTDQDGIPAGRGRGFVELVDGGVPGPRQEAPPGPSDLGGEAPAEKVKEPRGSPNLPGPEKGQNGGHGEDHPGAVGPN